MFGTGWGKSGIKPNCAKQKLSREAGTVRGKTPQFETTFIWLLSVLSGLLDTNRRWKTIRLQGQVSHWVHGRTGSPYLTLLCVCTCLYTTACDLRHELQSLAPTRDQIIYSWRKFNFYSLNGLPDNTSPLQLSSTKESCTRKASYHYRVRHLGEEKLASLHRQHVHEEIVVVVHQLEPEVVTPCLLYTSDAADE